jgi:hypothetical protein
LGFVGSAVGKMAQAWRHRIADVPRLAQVLGVMTL